MLAEHSLVGSLENIRPSEVDWGCTTCMHACNTSFLSSHTSCRDFLTPLLAQHQIWLRFRRRRAFIRSRLLTSFRHGTLLSNLIVRKKKTSRNSLCWANTEGDSIHLLRNFLWSQCQRVDLWYQHIWFGSWSPNWLCQITNQEQLCGFWKHVSLWDFFRL